MKKLFPPDVIRGYWLDVEIHSSADDEEYYLCFSNDGEMFVYVFYSPNKSYSQGHWSEKIAPSNFDNHSVDDVPLRQLVRQKLSGILPPGSETEH